MFKVTVIALCISAATAVDFAITNNEKGEIWIGIQGNSGKGVLEGGGFVLGAGQTQVVSSPSNWGGRFWARTWCDQNSKHCLTGDCGNKLQCGGAGGQPPVTLAEINLKADGGLDFYDLSLVDGFNLAATFGPVGGQGDGSRYSCAKATCLNFRQHCPSELVQDSPHGPVACKSACTEFNTDEYCCRNAHNTRDTCKSTDWPKNYPAIFKQYCPDAYSYAFDDNKSLYTCKAEKYEITFGGAN